MTLQNMTPEEVVAELNALAVQIREEMPHPPPDTIIFGEEAWWTFTLPAVVRSFQPWYIRLPLDLWDVVRSRVVP